MRKRSMFFLKTPYLCDLDTARYKGRLQSRNPGMTGISLHIDQHTKQYSPCRRRTITFYSGRGCCFDWAIYCLMIALFL